MHTHTQPQHMPILQINKKIKFDYQILETYQAGLSLSGAMTKEVRSRRVNINNLFIVFQNNRLEIINFGNQKLQQNVPLLLHKREISKITGKISEKGVSCVVLNLKTVERWIKAEIAVVKGNKKFDKRQNLKNKDLDRDMQREIKGF